MRIWIDLINSPQVSFWVPFIKEFEKAGHKVVLTSRDSGNTIALIKHFNLKSEIIGGRAGTGRFQKIILFSKRVLNLHSFIRKNKIDVSVSQSSFYQPLVSWLNGIPSLYTNDNEHAKGNWFGFRFANTVVLPVALKNKKFILSRSLNSKVAFYPGVKEAVYLSQQNNWFSTNGVHRETVYFRPEPWSAQYYRGPLNFFDETLIKLSSEYEVVVLPRDKNQVDHFKKDWFNKLTVADKPLSFDEIAKTCKLFIGAGGSMTRELAVIGLPVISIYQDEVLEVDKYLAEKGRMLIKPDISYEEIIRILKNNSTTCKKLSALEEGKESFQMILNFIYNLKN